VPRNGECAFRHTIRSHGRPNTGVAAPLLRVGEDERPTLPRLRDEARLRVALVLISSLLGHAALFAFLPAEPEMTASIGQDAITVEIVVGAESAAGTAKVRSDAEAEQQLAMEARQDEPAQEKSNNESRTQPDSKVMAAEEAIAAVQKEVAPPEQNVGETPPEPKPLEALPQSKPAPSTASAPASSIGRGRMIAGDANYQGLVAARLARFKRFPEDARRRREQGSALVSFTIDGAGRGTSVRLRRGTGFAVLDEEVQAMVRRASPFPIPPRGADITFSAPVSFHLK